MRKRLLEIYHKLLKYFGPQNWWPARTSFEVIIGAILTQNTNWGNVEKAIDNLRAAGLLSVRALSRVPKGRLERHIRPSGFYRQKAKRLKAFLRFLKGDFGGSISRMFREETGALREKLLSLNGIGPETADSILLYAGEKLSFVVDAYTRRILSRLGVYTPDAYGEVQGLFHRSLPGRVVLYKEYHALLVELAKGHCRVKPLCGGCPLSARCKYRQKTYRKRERGNF